jgi:ABC-type glutathione transport system ATPase component
MPSTPPEAVRCRIEIDRLRKNFSVDGREMVAVDDASFRINDGEFVALLGPRAAARAPSSTWWRP